MTWGERFMETLTDPDNVGASEYRAVYELMEDVIASTDYDGDDARESVLSTLDELDRYVQSVRVVVRDLV